MREERRCSELGLVRPESWFRRVGLGEWLKWRGVDPQWLEMEKSSGEGGRAQVVGG